MSLLTVPMSAPFASASVANRWRRQYGVMSRVTPALRKHADHAVLMLFTGLPLKLMIHGMLSG